MCWLPCWLLTGQTPHHFLRTFLVQADTDQRAARVVDCPITSPIPLDGHSVYSLKADGAERAPCPWLTLLAATPATIGGLVRVPDLAVAFIPLQHGLVCVTVWAILVCRLRRTLVGGVGGWAGAWTLSHSEACSTCALTLAKSTPRKVTMISWPCRVAFRVMTDRCLWQGTVLSRSPGLAGAGACSWPLCVGQLGLGQLLCTPDNRCTQPMFAEAVWCLGEVLTGALAIDDVVGRLCRWTGWLPWPCHRPVTRHRQPTRS